MEWGDYRPLVPAYLNMTLPDVEADEHDIKDVFDHVMRHRVERITLVRSLLAKNNVPIAGSEVGMQNISDWFLDNIDGAYIKDAYYWPAQSWLSVASDLALLIGEFAISRFPHLRWGIYRSSIRGDVHANLIVLTGFRIKNSDINLDQRIAQMGTAHLNDPQGPRDILVRTWRTIMDDGNV